MAWSSRARSTGDGRPTYCAAPSTTIAAAGRAVSRCSQNTTPASDISQPPSTNSPSDLAPEEAVVDTPLERTAGRRVSGKKLTLVPILRAGLGMVEGIYRLVPGARVGHIGLYRDHDTLEPVDYYFKVPSDASERDFFLLDPMLATGGSAAAAVSSLKRAGATRIRFLCLVAAPEGVRRLAVTHPDVMVYCAALDRALNEQGYIMPGLGGAGY